MGDERHTMMLALDVDPMGGGDWRWRWYDHDSGRTLADGVEGDVVAAWRAATTHHVKSSNELLWSLDDRAEAAEQRAEAAERELAQARAAAARERDRMRGNVDALRARAEAAEQRAEALAAELAQARADALRLVGELYIADESNLFRTMLDVCGVEDLRDQLDALDLKIDRFDAPGLGAVVRRAVARWEVSDGE